MALAIFGSSLQRSASGEANNIEKWIGTWSASPTRGGVDAKHVREQTLREIVHTTIGGNEVRIRISNTFGEDRLTIGAVHVALHGAGSAVIPSTDHAVTFSGRSSISVPPGALVLSDAIPFRIPAQIELAISIYFPEDVPQSTVHPSALQDSYASGAGKYVGADSLQNPTILQSWPFLTGVDVAVNTSAATIVALGDSITDGTQSTPRIPTAAGRMFWRSGCTLAVARLNLA